MITFSVERMEDPLMDEMVNLWEQHWEEVANFQDKIKLNVDRDWYKLTQDNGLYVMVTAREEGALVGYAGFIIMSHPHYADNIFSNMDVAFLDKAHRKGFTGIRMFKFAEQALKDLDVDVIIYRSKVHYDLSRLFEHLGCSKLETAYSKYIGE